jgi:hypothetical protein
MVVDLSRNSVECNRSVAIKFKKIIEAVSSIKIPHDVEVLYLTQKSCNASVACNTPFSCRL